MKFNILPIFALSLAASALNAVQEADYRYVFSPATGEWTTSTWDVYKGNTTEKVNPADLGISLYPDSNKVVMQFNWGTSKIDVNGNFTVGKITSNPSMGVTQGSNVTLNLKETSGDWEDAILTIDTSYIESSGDSATRRYAMNFVVGAEHSMSKWNNNPESKLTIKGGVINMGNTLENVSTGIRMTGTGAPDPTSTLTSPLKKTLTFDADSTVNCNTALYFAGSTAETILGVANSCAYVTYNLDGILNVRKNTGTDLAPVYENKDIEFGSNEGTVVLGAHYNVGGTINAAKMTFATNCEVNFNSGSVVNATGQMKFSDWGKPLATYVNFNSGSTVNIASMWIGDKTVMNIAGKMKVTGQFYAYQNSQAIDTTFVNIKQGASLDIGGGIDIAQMSFIVEKGVDMGSIIVRSGGVRLDNINARLSLYSSNVFKKTDTGSQKEMLIGVVRGDVELGMYANQEFKNINFENTLISQHTSKIDYMILNWVIGDMVTEISLESLAGGTLKLVQGDVLKRNLVFDGFRNYLIHLDTKNDADNLSLISSLNGDWIDFRYDVDEFGGYWLNATYVPEPSTVAAIFGALALGLAVWRKRARK